MNVSCMNLHSYVFLMLYVQRNTSKQIATMTHEPNNRVDGSNQNVRTMIKSFN